MLASSLRYARLAVVIALVAPVRAASTYVTIQAEGAAAASTVAFEDLEIELTLPKLAEMSQATPELDTCKGEWRGKLGSCEARVQLFVLGRSDYDFFEPEDVVETWRDTIRDPDEDGEGKHHQFTFEPTRSIAALAGCTPILATVQGSKTSKTDAAQKYALVLVGSLLPKHGWLVRADVSPPPDADTLRAFVAELEKCVTYKGKPCDPKWTEDEARAYWQRIAPESTWKKFEKPTRTKHFIVLTNSTSPGPFVKKLEGWYESIAKIVPVDELAGRKLLPIVLFRTDDDFQNFYRAYYKMEQKDEVQDVSIAVGDWIATSCDYDNEYQHMFDVTTQLLTVRARASDGNQWFRLGLCHYAARKPRERSAAYKAVKKGRYSSLSKLFDNGIWDEQYRERDMTGTSEETSYWDQGALWMEFLHTGPWPKDSFARFVRTVGSIPQTDDAAIRAALESIYGMDLTALEKKWVQFCSKK